MSSDILGDKSEGQEFYYTHSIVCQSVFNVQSAELIEQLVD